MNIALVIVETIGVLGGLGASWRLAWVRGRASGRLARVLRPCSCSHGFGGHGKDGCQMRIMVECSEDRAIGDGTQYPYKQVYRWSELHSCGCKRFDGEVPPEAYVALPEAG